jgi:hypothetical protein
MNEDEVLELAQRLRRIGGYSTEGILAKFLMTPIETKQGVAVYLTVWQKSNDELVFFNLLPVDSWNEAFLNELIVQLKKASQASSEDELQSNIRGVALFIKSFVTEQNFESN